MKSLLTALLAAAVLASGAFGAGAGRTFRGDGTVLLPPMRFAGGTTVRWRATGGLFMLIALKAPAAAGPNPQLIVSRRSSGTGYLPAGRYRFKISGFGSWTVRFG